MNYSAISFADIFKSDFLSRAVENFSVVDVFITMAISVLIGLFIYYVYKRSYNSVMYSHSFNISLVILTCVTALVIMAVTANIVLSLGMVGALSIVRFRTAIKDPMDVVFLFWAIAAGIVTGSGMFLLSLLGSIFIGLIIVVLSKVKNYDDPYLLILNLETVLAEDEIMTLLKQAVKRYGVKSKSIFPGGAAELTVEIRVKDNETTVLNSVSALPGVKSAVMVSYNGDYVI